MRPPWRRLHRALGAGLGACTLLALLALLSAAHGEARAAADSADQRVQFREAMAQAAKPGNTSWKRLASSLEEAGYPLTPYIELAALRRQIRSARTEDIERFLARWPASLPASDLREAWLRELARRGDWHRFRASWSAEGPRDLKCSELQARLAENVRLDYAADIAPLWEDPRPLPQSCAPILRSARQSGILDDATVEGRVARAVEQGDIKIATAAAALLDGAARSRADRLVAALRDPPGTLTNAVTWTDDIASREAAATALTRLARRNSAAAEAAWGSLEPRFQWNEAQRERVLHALALYRSTSYSADATARLDALPGGADDDATRAWRVRVALATQDWAATLAALDRLSSEQQRDERWRYLRARVLGKLDRAAEAAPLYAELASEANFHGFLAADWIDRPYAICPQSLPVDGVAEAAIAAQPDLLRAFEFRELGMQPEARREWQFALQHLDSAQRRRAADLAYRRGWYDRAVFTYSADPETIRFYEQRFPIAMEKLLREEAAGAAVEPAFAYAIIRAESAWMSDARSHADAYGLMQLLPSVGKQVAKSEGLPWTSPADLLKPHLNVQLGTRYLGRMAERYQGSPWLASAAYNAGAAPVGRWLAARGALEPDFFIETIPYRETREYVARVLAFSVIYDWRLNGTVLPLTARMPRPGQAFRLPQVSSPRKQVVCPTESH